jgi:uncharacterized secreted protein with C-terminal beta-propeller domain
MRRILCTFLFAAACQKASTLSSQKPPDIRANVALAPAASCDSLQQTVQDTAVQQMRSQLDAYKSGQYYAYPTAGGPVAANGPATSAAPASYSTTNVQVPGVDEADFVKNDGTRIFVLSRQTLFAATSWPPQNLALTGSLAIEGWPTDMFLQGNQIVVFSGLWSSLAQDSVASPIACIDVCSSGASTTKITVVDVSDLANPQVTAQIYLPGYEQGARRIGSSVRLVLTDQVRWPAGVQWWPPYDPAWANDQQAFVAAIDALEDANEKIIRATPISSWFPDGERKLDDGTVVDLGYQCSDFYVANAPEKLGLVTVATLDLDNLDAGVSRASIVGESGTVYANASHLYIASAHWWWWQLTGQIDWTYVHEFDISDPSKAGYLGSGGVPGTVLDQYSMDEQDGYLRIATTLRGWSQDPSTNLFTSKLDSQLSVLGPASSAGLSTIASLELVPDEGIQGMRFVGNQGYAVTFRQVDPLVTLDLSDPAHPKKVAELTLPGFSTYLQPIDAGHLLAIGIDEAIDSNNEPIFNQESLKLSVFDVSDLGNPKLAAQTVVGTAWSWSEALWDPHAFSWYQPDPSKPGLLAIPFSDWDETAANWWSSFVSDARVFQVTDSSITAAGSLGMNDVFIQVGYGDWVWWYRPYVRRSVLATDDAGNQYLYAVSDAGLRVGQIGQLSTPIATALFPAPAP